MRKNIAVFGADYLDANDYEDNNKSGNKGKRFASDFKKHSASF